MDATTKHPTPSRPRHNRRAPRPDLTHWPKAHEVQVRPAMNLDGADIHELVDAMTTQYGYTIPKCDWSYVEPYWYVAEIGDWIVGAVQICPGRPFGHIGMIAVHLKLSHTKKAKIVKLLAYRAFLALKLGGNHLVSMMVPDQESEFTRILQRWGARASKPGRMLFFALDGSNGV